MVRRTDSYNETYEVDYPTFMRGVNIVMKKVLQSRIKYEDIYAIPRGGLVLGVYLSHRLRLPMTNHIKQKTLIVDDICDTGITLQNERFKNNDKVVLVVKTAGADAVPDVKYAFGVANNVWVRFPWEVEDV